MAIERFRLSPEQKQRLIDLEEDIRVLGEEIERAERIGLDVGTLKDEYERGKKLREGMLREYS